MKKYLVLIALLGLCGCGQNDNHAWLGYAEGDTAFVAAPQAGWVANLRVERGADVKSGDLLFSLDDTNQVSARDQAKAAIAQAQGQMGQAQASLALAQKELVRQSGLLRAGATSKQAYDQAKSAYDTAAALIAQIRASEDQARATLTGATYQLSERDIVSRTSGRVQDIFFRPGEYAPAMTPVVSILPPGECLCAVLRARDGVLEGQARPEGLRHVRWLRARASPQRSPSSPRRKSSRRR